MKETPIQNAAAPGFLAALAAITRHEDFSIEILPEESRLRVTIQVEGHEPLEAIGPAAALDAQLPAAITKYAAWVESRMAKDEVKIDLPGAVAREPVRKKAKRAPRKAAAKKKPVARVPVRKAAPKRPAAPRPAVKKQRAAPAGKPDKAACIADYQAMKAKHGNKLTRRLFVDQGTTGRRYETLWANSWPAFEKEADAGKGAKPSAAPTGKKETVWPFPTGAEPGGGKSRTPAKAVKPKKAAAPKKEAAPKDDKRPWTVKADKKTLGVTILEKKPGDSYTCNAGAFTVKTVDAEKREIHVAPAGAKAEQPVEPPPLASAESNATATEQTA